MLAKSAWDFPKLNRRFDDISVSYISFISQNNLFDLFFEGPGFFASETYLVPPFSWPQERPIERLRSKVGREKRDGIEAESFCRVDRFAQMTMIGLLDSCATSYRNGWGMMTYGGDAFVDEVIGAAYASNGIVNILWAVERDNDVVKEGCNFLGTFMEEKAGGQESEVNILLAEEVAEGREIIVEQRFTASENNLPDAKIFERETMAL